MTTIANIETAMCLWEAALELRVQIPELNRMWEDEGTVAMRHTIIGWIDECEAKWEADQANGTELVPYDWEHCPDFLLNKLLEQAA